MSDEWPATTTETGPGVVTANFSLCYRSGATELECNGNASFAATGTQHRYEVSATMPCAGGARRIKIHGFTDLDADRYYPIEFVH